MTAITFTVYGVAAPAGSKKAFVNKRTGRAHVVDDSKRSRPWKSLVTDAAVKAMRVEIDGHEYGIAPLEGPLHLEITFWVARPKAHLAARGGVKPSAPFAPITRPDLLKLARAVEDAIVDAGVMRDDAQITVETLQKAYTESAPRTEIRVVPVADPREHRPLPADTKGTA